MTVLCIDQPTGRQHKSTPNLDVAAGPRPRLRPVPVLLLSLLGCVSAFRQTSAGDDQPKPQGIPVPQAISVPPLDAARDAERLAEVRVPDGYQATIFAAPPAVLYPVFVAAAANGTLYVSVDRNGSIDREPHRGSVYRLRDLDDDGRADEVLPFIPDIDSPRGLVWDHDRLYLMHPPHLSVFIDRDHDGIVDERQVLVKNIAFTFRDRPADHTSNGVTLGIDGWLYLAIGDFGFQEAEGTDGTKLQLRGGGVVRVRPDGSGLELYARGTRNILEVAVDPLLNGFTRDNTNDGGGWDIRLHQFSGGEEHGYPSLFTNFADEIVPPLAEYGGGSGCGGLYLDEPGFPAEHGAALYTADWGRDWVYRHQLTPRGAAFDIDQQEAFGLPRATDLDVDGLSRLYIASWRGATFTYNGDDVGYVVQVRPRGYTPPPLPDFAQLSPLDLVEHLRSPSHRRRLAAQRQLVRRLIDQRDAAAEAALLRLAGDADQPLAHRVAALFALRLSLGQAAIPHLAALTKEPALLPWAIRALADDPQDRAVAPLEPVLRGLFDAQPRARLESLRAAARLQLIDVARELTPLLADADPLVAHTAVQSLTALRAEEACFVVLDESAGDDPRRRGALRVLQSLHHTSVVDGLLLRLERERDAARRAGLWTALCRLVDREGPWQGNSWGTRPDTRGPYYQPEPWPETARITAALRMSLAAASGDEAGDMLRELARHRVSFPDLPHLALDLVERDGRLAATVVGLLSREAETPRKAWPLLTRVARDGIESTASRADAAIALWKADDGTAFAVGVEVLAALHAVPAARADFDRCLQTYRQADLLEPRAAELVALASDAASSTAAWGDVGLVVLSTHRGDRAAGQLARDAIERAWAEPVRRRRLLEAAQLLNERRFGDHVRRAAGDDDAQIARLARKIAEDWRLDLAVRPTGPTIKSLGVEAALVQVRQRQGDPKLGEQLFARLNCGICHTVAAGDAPRGPFLPNVARTYNRDQLAEAILLPSKSIAQGFATQLFVLADGRSINGFVAQESAEQVWVRDQEGREFKLRLDEIDERAPVPTSIMPPNLADEVTVDQFASLVDYLRSLGD